jgi:hypothetical protein
MASKVARLTDSAEPAAVTLLSQIHSRTAEPSELLPPADNTDFCSAALHIYRRLRRPAFSSCASHSASFRHFEIKLLNVNSANFCAHYRLSRLRRDPTNVNSLGLSARFMNHTPTKSCGLVWSLVMRWVIVPHQ